MPHNIIEEIRAAVIESDLFDRSLFGDSTDPGPSSVDRISRIESALGQARHAREGLREISQFLYERVISRILEMDRLSRNLDDFRKTKDLLERLLVGTDEFKREPGFVEVYADLLSLYILTLYRCGGPGGESPIIRMILTNIAARKAPEISRATVEERIGMLEGIVTISIIAKRYAVYVLAVQGLKVLFRAEIDFRTYGNSPEPLALRILNLFLKHGVKLSEVKDIVCAGGDLETLPDGIYVLDEPLMDLSKKRLNNSSINLGALVSWELRELLNRQGERDGVRLSLANPLSFTTLDPHDFGCFINAQSTELIKGLKGYVKVTPLKSIAALLSEMLRIGQEHLNLLVMSLDELFASVVRKTGPRITRELAAQDANEALSKFDFGAIVEAIRKENFQIPETFRLATRNIGTGVKEICELLMIIDSGKLSPGLSAGLMQIVDTYARRVAMVLEMVSAGTHAERPHFVVITSMMALDSVFQKLFSKIRNRIDNPFTPIMCLDSLEHEYLISNHLFEVHLSPAKRDGRLRFSQERISMRRALQVLGASGEKHQIFSFGSLLDRVTEAMAGGRIAAGNVVLVGADNEDALEAAAHAREFGLLKRLVLIGDPTEVMTAIERTKVPLAPGTDPDVEILPIDPLAVDHDGKQQSIARVFHQFLSANRDFFVMKGSISSSALLREALAIYKPTESGDGDTKKERKTASHTAFFVLPDGRFFAMSDAGVNPGFRNPDILVQVIENQVEIVRKMVDPGITLKVAIITAVEKETAAIPATQLAGEAEEKAVVLEKRYGPLIVEGPLSFDLATVPEVAEEKAYEGRIRGDANCLVATDINTANVLYKMMSKTMTSLGVMVESGGIITAGPGTVPIVLTSRGDTAETKFNSILLALAYCGKEGCLTPV
ncbi:MAG: phosphate acyltransferase [Pseudomonadota bacterium]